MNFLPPEIQLDIFKCLNFKQLLNIQQTNCFYKNFVKEYENQLALKEFYKIKTVYIYKGSLPYIKFFKPEPKFYDFELSEELEKKWKWVMEKSIPLFLSNDMEGIYVSACQIEQSSECKQEILLQFSNVPTNIEEMKIARYLLNQLFKCVFESTDFSAGIFNPQMIQLLFDENKTNIPLQIHSHVANLSIDKGDFSKFALNHLISRGFIANVSLASYIEQCRNNLFEILINRGNRFSNVWYTNATSIFYNLIIQHIETSKDLSKMVKEITLSNVHGDILKNKRTENIEKEIGFNNLRSVKYQLSNKYNPKMKFSVNIKEVSKLRFNVEIREVIERCIYLVIM
uniref:F-box domain-containing protein n=1 Tax=Meloidogyne enterolobii TaxID=390850 RepID=A0A6V7UEB5_MELEN|nr:unnamed protein product [Meloidogyne enterolobii]